MKYILTTVPILFFVLFSSSQVNFSDSLKRQVHHIDSIISERDSLDYIFTSNLEGSSRLLGKYTGKVYRDNVSHEVTKTSIIYFLGEIVFYCNGKTLLKVCDKSDYYFINNTFYDKEGIKANSSDIIQKLEEYGKMFKMMFFTRSD